MATASGRARRTAVTMRRTSRAPSGVSTRPSTSTRSTTPSRRARRDERRRQRGLELVELGAHLPADLEHVLEARRRDEDYARPTPLEQRVGGDRRPVVQARARIRSCGDEGGAHGPAGVVRRRAHLADHHATASDRDQVREGPAGVGPSEDDARGQEAVVAGVVVPALVSALPLDFAVDSLLVSEPPSLFDSDFDSPSLPPLLPPRP